MRWWWHAELQHPRGDEEEQTREPERETRAQQPQWPAPRKNGCDCSTSLLPADGIERMVEQHCVLQHGRRCSAASFRVCVMPPLVASSSRRMPYVAYELVAISRQRRQPRACSRRQPTRHYYAAMSMHWQAPHPPPPQSSKQQTCHQRNCLSFPCSSTCRRS